MSDIVRLPSTTIPTCWTATGFTIEKVLAAASRKTSPAQQRQVPIHKQPFCYQGKRLRLEENCAVMSKTPASHRSKTSRKFCFPPRMPSFNRHSCQSFQTCTDCRAYGRLVQQAEVHVERDGSKPDKTIAHCPTEKDRVFALRHGQIQQGVYEVQHGHNLIPSLGEHCPGMQARQIGISLAGFKFSLAAVTSCMFHMAVAGGYTNPPFASHAVSWKP